MNTIFYFNVDKYIIRKFGASFGANISTISVQNSEILYIYSVAKETGTNRYKSV